MSDLETRKAEARKAAFERRKAAHADDPGTGAAVLSSVLAGYRGVPLAGYVPIRSEINPLPAMAEASAHGRVGVPVIDGKGQPLRFAVWTPSAPMEAGPFGAMVPKTLDFFEPEILIVPLVAFDARGGRLGYGGGFYDRTLEALRRSRPTLAIGFCYAAQEAEILPLETTDQPLDLIVTETDVREPRR